MSQHSLTVWPEPPLLKIDKERCVHTLYYGRSTKGRDRQMMYQMKSILERQDVKVGITVVVETPRLGAVLHNLATAMGRKVFWLNPQIHLGVRNQLVWMESYDEEVMDKWVVDYPKMIRNGYVVIVDLEPLRYFHRYDFAVSLVLWHLRIKLDKVYARDRKPHAILVENTARHLEDLVFFLEYGHCYDLSCLLWADSPAAFQGRRNYLSLLEMSISNTYLNARHAISDLDYYEQIFSEIPRSILKDVSPDLMLYRLEGADHQFYQGYCSEETLSDEEFKRYRNNAKKSMTMLIKKSIAEERQQEKHLQAAASGDLTDQLKVLAYQETIVPKHEKEQSVEYLQAEALQRHLQSIPIARDWFDDEF